MTSPSPVERIYEAAETWLSVLLKSLTDVERASRANATFRAAIAKVLGEAWQPIETAPKDGPFLVCFAPDPAQGEREPTIEMVGGLKEY